MRRGQLAQHEGRPVVVVRGQLEAAQALGAQPRRQPGEHGADVAALERLLERPQAVAARDQAGPGVDDQQLPDVEAEPGERPGREVGGRIEDHHRAAGLLRRDERRGEQADLADARMRQQQLAQAAPRPAAARQLGIERGKAARHPAGGAAAELVAEPERGMERFRRAPRRAARRRRETAACGSGAHRGGNSRGQDVHLMTVRLYSIDGKPGDRILPAGFSRSIAESS